MPELLDIQRKFKIMKRGETAGVQIKNMLQLTHFTTPLLMPPTYQALTTANTGRTVSVRARNPNHSAWAGATPHSGHHSASPAMLRSTHTSDFFYLTAGSCDPARQEHFYSALETFVRRWRPATFDYVVHTGRRRVSSGLAGPHPDSTDSRGRSTSQPRRMLT